MLHYRTDVPGKKPVSYERSSTRFSIQPPTSAEECPGELNYPLGHDTDNSNLTSGIPYGSRSKPAIKKERLLDVEMHG